MRAFLSEKAIVYGQEKPVLGWGSRSFVPLLAAREGSRLPAWMMQPIHNSWVGLLFEIGFPGLVVFGTIIILRLSLFLKSKNVPRGTFLTSNDILYVSIVSGLIITGCFLMLLDHYILDVHQTSLLFWLVLGL
jgi:O-antigen ligase